MTENERLNNAIIAAIEERDALRAERDNAIAECLMHIGNAKALRAERDEWHNVATAAGLRIVDIRAERDALRALLREARAALPDMRHNELLRAKLDAALAGKDAT